VTHQDFNIRSRSALYYGAFVSFMVNTDVS